MNKIMRFLGGLQKKYPSIPVRRFWRYWIGFSMPIKKIHGSFENYLKVYSSVYLIVLVLLFPTALGAGQSMYFKASWYSVSSLRKDGQWKITKGVMANGHRFSDEGLTCATRLYPLGSTLRVVNRENSKAVVVRVTDRIGKRFAKTRVDLSKGAFGRIASLDRGTVPVEVKEVKQKERAR